MTRFAQTNGYGRRPTAEPIPPRQPVVRRDAAALYRDAARLLVRAYGAFAAELVRKRAVSARLMGDTEAASDWAKVADEVVSVLGYIQFGRPNPRRSP